MSVSVSVSVSVSLCECVCVSLSVCVCTRVRCLATSVCDSCLAASQFLGRRYTDYAKRGCACNSARGEAGDEEEFKASALPASWAACAKKEGCKNGRKIG